MLVLLLPEHRDVFIAQEKLQNVLTVLNDVLNDDANIRNPEDIFNALVMCCILKRIQK